MHNTKAIKNRSPQRSPAAKTPETDLSAVKTLSKALEILDAFAAADGPLNVSEVALRSGVSRPTTHRLIHTLIAHGYLAQDGATGRIAPGYSILRLAGSLLDNNRLRLASLPHLEKLAQATGERVNLGIAHRNHLLYLAGIEKPSLPTIYSRIGKTMPLYCSALGKAILAHSPEEVLKTYLRQESLVSHTDHTITDESGLRDELAKIRQDGFAVDREELMAGTVCLASAVLVSGRPVGALGLSGRSLESLLSHSRLVQHTAEVVAYMLGRSY